MQTRTETFFYLTEVLLLTAQATVEFIGFHIPCDKWFSKSCVVVLLDGVWQTRKYKPVVSRNLAQESYRFGA